MSDPNNDAQLYKFDAELAASLRHTSSPQEGKGGSLGIELPFDFCLVRGKVLRDLQARCRQAEFEASLRSRVIGNLMAQIHAEQFKPKKGTKKHEQTEDNLRRLSRCISEAAYSSDGLR